MKLSTKLALIIFGVGIIGIGTYIYLLFNGNPYIEHKLSLQEKAYAERKYGFKVKIVESEYNFKDGSYQTTVKPVDHPSFLVYQEVQPGGKKAFVDSYPEVLWSNQLKALTLPVLNKLFQDASKIDIAVPTGSGYNLRGSEIPPYKEMEKLPYRVDLTIERNHTNSENQRIFDMIDFLKKLDYPFVIIIRYQDKLVNIPAKDLNNIQSENDINNYAH